MVIHVMQWNARSLVANGQEFKKFVLDLDHKPSIICVQESWLKPNLQFTLPGYKSIRKDRVGKQGGGVVTFIKEGTVYRELCEVIDMECVVVEIYFREDSIVIYNFYNPCKKISIKLFEKIKKEKKELWCGDFNAHNWLWGSKNTDYNGEIIEQLMDERSLVCLNTGEGTRYNITENSVSSIDLTLITNSMAELCEWKINGENTVGSDHFPIICKMNVDNNPEYVLQKKWLYEKADWNSFSKHCEENKDLMVEDSVETFCDSITSIIMEAATHCIYHKEWQVRKTKIFHGGRKSAVMQLKKGIRHLNNSGKI